MPDTGCENYMKNNLKKYGVQTLTLVSIYKNNLLLKNILTDQSIRAWQC